MTQTLSQSPLEKFVTDLSAFSDPATARPADQRRIAILENVLYASKCGNFSR
jgi:hypothetical protein